jgi:hypothetical protein
LPRQKANQTPNRQPRWRTWEGGTARRIAQTVYEGRTFERLPLLPDALEDAGLLGHLCGPARGVVAAAAFVLWPRPDLIARENFDRIQPGKIRPQNR